MTVDIGNNGAFYINFCCCEKCTANKKPQAPTKQDIIKAITDAVYSTEVTHGASAN